MYGKIKPFGLFNNKKLGISIENPSFFLFNSMKFNKENMPLNKNLLMTILLADIVILMKTHLKNVFKLYILLLII